MVDHKIIILITTILFCNCILRTENAIIGINKLVDDIHYDKNIRPNFGKQPVDVEIEPILTTLGPINEQDMTFEISFILRLWWSDPRLKNNGSLEEITSNSYPGDTIWIPDVYIVNVREVIYFTQFTRTVIDKNGSVYFSQKVTAKCTCHMDLTKYPMDTQKCGVQFESYAFSKEDLLLIWHPKFRDHVPMKDKLSLTGYDVIKVTTMSKDVIYGATKYNSFDNLFLFFHVKRTSVYYIYKGFLPTMAMTIFNLCSYWLPDNAMPARISLIITTFLANTFILQSVSDQTVKVSYTTAMQLFLLVNVIFLMTSILQYLVVLHLKKNSEKRDERLKGDRNFNVDSGGKNSQSIFEMNGSVKHRMRDGKLSNHHLEIMEKAFFLLTDEKKERVHALDRIFRILMPFLYLLFCTVYFSYYLD